MEEPRKSLDSPSPAESTGNVSDTGLKFNPTDISKSLPPFQLPDEIWTSIIATLCPFEPGYFLSVVENLIKNPNITSSVVCRADIYYDSENDVSVSENSNDPHFSRFTKHMMAELRPIKINVPNYQWLRTWVRQMVPRNPQLDKSLVQTCHLYREEGPASENHLVLFIPHLQNAAEMPFYHPAVKALAFLYEWDTEHRQGNLSIHYRLFEAHPLDNRLERTALNLLKIIHKHSVGRMNGYQKRVHHDQVVPQKEFQDTYARLKAKYAKSLIADWREHTDPEKHVFEDLGIAAFLIELWSQMYGVKSDGATKFLGFVDIGCGNGVLVYILLEEGYEGWGFDARARKSWSMFPAYVREKVKEMCLVPKTLYDANKDSGAENTTLDTPRQGVFPSGTFIISNHADELTAWTPLLAYMNESPFIAIPCCSHDLAGSRTRFHQQKVAKLEGQARAASKALIDGAGPSTGSLAKEPNRPKQISAYAGLTCYVETLAEEVGYVVDKEMLRIPSTRNAAVLGYRRARAYDASDLRDEKLAKIVERDVGSLDVVGKRWVERTLELTASTASLH